MIKWEKSRELPVSEAGSCDGPIASTRVYRIDQAGEQGSKGGEIQAQSHPHGVSCSTFTEGLLLRAEHEVGQLWRNRGMEQFC